MQPTFDTKSRSRNWATRVASKWCHLGAFLVTFNFHQGGGVWFTLQASLKLFELAAAWCGKERVTGFVFTSEGRFTKLVNHGDYLQCVQLKSFLIGLLLWSLYQFHMSDVDTNMFASDDAFGIAVSILVKHVFHSSSMDWRYWKMTSMFSKYRVSLFNYHLI